MEKESPHTKCKIQSCQMKPNDLRINSKTPNYEKRIQFWTNRILISAIFFLFTRFSKQWLFSWEVIPVLYECGSHFSHFPNLHLRSTTVRENEHATASLLGLLGLSETSTVFDSGERPLTSLIKVTPAPSAVRHRLPSAWLAVALCSRSVGTWNCTSSLLVTAWEDCTFIFLIFLTYLFRFGAPADRSPASNKPSWLMQKFLFAVTFKVLKVTRA